MRITLGNLLASIFGPAGARPWMAVVVLMLVNSGDLHDGAAAPQSGWDRDEPEIDPPTCEEVRERQVMGAGEELEGPTLELYACGTDVAADEARSFLDRRAALYDEVASFLDTTAAALPSLEYHLYQRLEHLALRTNRMEPAVVEFEARRVHLARERGIDGEDLNRDALVLLRSVLGRPNSRILETGLWMQFVERWHGEAPLYWTSWIARADAAWPVRQLFEQQASPGTDPQGWGRDRRADGDREHLNRSPLIRRALAAGLVDLLLREAGRAQFLEEYASWTPTEDEHEQLVRWWTPYLDSLVSARAEALSRRSERPVDLPPLEGFNFAHEGHNVVDGYASTRADSALTELAEMGVNAVSILPYAHLRGLHEPAPISVHHSADDENDASLRHVIHQARAREMSVLLKPHLWTGEGWIGDLEMRSDADWNRFFTYYERWISHYALLAEMENLPLFSVGVELEEATISRPDAWRGIIASVRGLYAGKLVYAANWGREFEQISFWEELDYMGIDWYYPLAKEETDPTEAALRERARALADRIGAMAEETGRPVMLTEVGFPSIQRPWMQPHEWRRDVGLSPEDQALCYRVLRSALEGEPWMTGIFWWKWPSDLRHGGPEHRGYTPNDKPAEAVVREWFTR